MRKITIVIIFLINSGSLFSQSLSKYIEDYNFFSNNILFQKIYVHTDKKIYLSQDTIFMKVYLLNAKKHHLDSCNQLIYIELIDAEGFMAIKKIYRPQNGLSRGEIALSDTLLSGTYTLRAYTDPMAYFGEKYYFTDTISIRTKNNFHSYNYYWKSRKYRKKTINFATNFDNTTLLNHQNPIIFLFSEKQEDIFLKVKEFQKKSTTYEVNKSGNIKFLLTPDINTKLKVDLFAGNKKIQTFKIKKFINKEIQIGFSEKENVFIFNLLHNTNVSGDKNALTYYFFIENNGRIYLKKKINIQLNKKIIVEKKDLPTGILNVIVLDNKFKMISRRHIYNEHKLSKFQMSVIREGEFMVITLKNDEVSNLSLSVSLDTSSTMSIEHYFNFYADLPYSKQKFFNFININDNLLATNDFKYNVSLDSLKKSRGNKFLIKKGLEIKGYISNVIENNPAKNIPLNITVLNSYNDKYQAFTNKKGRYIFSNLNYYDSLNFLIETQTGERMQHYVINYDQPTTTLYSYQILQPSEQIKNKKYEEKDALEDRSSLHSSADQIIYFDKIVTVGYNNIFEILQSRVPGFQRQGSSSLIRGFSSINQSNEPLYLIDDIPVNSDAVNSLNINDIDRVEILRSCTNSAIYGQRGANGIVAVYTKQGYNIEWGKRYGKIVGLSVNKQTTDNQHPVFHDLSTIFWCSDLEVDEHPQIIKIKLNKKVKILRIDAKGISSSGKLLNKSLVYKL